MDRPSIGEGLDDQICVQNQEMATEDDLATSIDESDRMRELQDKVACLRAQVSGYVVELIQQLGHGFCGVGVVFNKCGEML